MGGTFFDAYFNNNRWYWGHSVSVEDTFVDWDPNQPDNLPGCLGILTSLGHQGVHDYEGSYTTTSICEITRPV